MRLPNARKENELSPTLKSTWRQLVAKKEYIKGDITNEEMLEYVQKLYMYNEVTIRAKNMETPLCIDIKYVNKGTKNG